MNTARTLDREAVEFYDALVRRVVPRQRGARNPERVALMAVLRESGATLAAIGAQYGVSRERVRQLLGREGVKVRRPNAPVDPLAALALIRRDATIHTFQTAADRLGVDAHHVATLIAQLGLATALGRLFRWRRRAAHRSRYVAQIRAFVAREGRIPTSAEMGVKGGVPKRADLPSLTHAKGLFGSSAAMWAAVGVSPRASGHPGHLTARCRATHCHRGHEYTPETTYVWRVVRRCRVCKRARRHREANQS